jgi:hypothetical protein
MLKFPETPIITLAITHKGVGDAILTGNRLMSGYLFQLIAAEINKFDEEVRAKVKEALELDYKYPFKQKKEK